MGIILGRIRVFLPFLAIFIGALFVRSIDITEPFIGHHEWGAAFYSLVAVNHLQYGFMATKFLDMPLSYATSPEHFFYYINYPPLLGILVSISFMLFGVHEWATRLVPVLSSTGTLVLLYLIADHLWNRQIALIAAFFFAFMPLAVYFGRLTDTEIITVFFVLLLFYASIRWEVNGSIRWYGVMVGAFILGALTNWAAYFMVPLLLFSAFFRKEDIARIRSLLLFLVLAIALGCITILYFWYATGSIESLIHAFWSRTGDALGGGIRFSVVDLIILELKRGWLYFTPVVSLLSLAGLAGYFLEIFRTRNLERNAPEIHLLVLFIFGLAPLLIFPGAAFIHNYYLYFVLPAMAISAALGLGHLVQYSENAINRRVNEPTSYQRKYGLVFFGIVLVLFLIVGIPMINFLYSWDTPEFYEIGTYLHQNTKNEDCILSTTFVYPQIEYYARREIQTVGTDGDLVQALSPRTRPSRYIITRNGDPLHGHLMVLLVNNTPALIRGDWEIFTLPTVPS